MVNLYDIAYGIGLGISAPYWLINRSARVKVRSALRDRMGHVQPRTDHAPAVLIHAVSLGEINATRGLVQRLRDLRPDLHLIISSTTETGFARANELYGSAARITLLRYPLDFSRAVSRVLDNLRPTVVVLMELEAWPNFMSHCAGRGIPVLVVNGRITEPSFRRYRLLGPVVRRMFGRLAGCCVQDEINSRRFAGLGVPTGRIQITGTMKFDTATVADRVEGDQQLAADLGLASSQPLLVCGSTGPGEEQIILQQYRRLREKHSGLRLAIIPRHPQRFDEVARLIAEAGFGLVRRSRSDLEAHDPTAVLLGDTMGELRKFYSLASIVFVGRTLVDLGPRQHGSDMIEPAALAKPVIVGPYTTNFADAMSQFRAANAIVEVGSGEELGAAVDRLLRDQADARTLGDAARNAVLRGKGATERHAQEILRYL